MKIPDGFNIPTHFEFKIQDNCNIRILPLNRLMAKEDYNLVISNRRHLKGIFGKLDDWWPSDDLSEKENYSMLLWHEKQFENKKSFAYAIMFNNKYIGCFYIYGLEEVYEIVSVVDFDMLYVFMWTSESMYHNGIDNMIFNHLKLWVEKEWNFAKADYPGRVTPLVSYKNSTASWIKTEKQKNNVT